MMIYVVSKSVILEEKLEQAKTLYAELVRETRKEEGCISYGLFEDIKNKRVLAVLEQWKTQECLDRHTKSPHMLRIGPQLKECKQSADLTLYRQLI